LPSDPGFIIDFDIKFPYITLEKKRFPLITSIYEELCLNIMFSLSTVQIYVLGTETVFVSQETPVPFLQ
jgi:hypothetical protein